MVVRSARRIPIGIALAGILVLSAASAARAQSPGTDAGSPASISGRLYDSLTAAPLAGALVVLEELRREVRADADARYRFDDVPPGTYHVSVRMEGYSRRRTEVTVGSQPVVLDLGVDPELHFEEVVSVGPGARSAFEAYQPTSVLSGQELTKRMAGSLGETLAEQPGVANRSLGPAPSRPVIRGLDGDRVAILEDGIRTGDMSSQSGDHAVSVNPAAAHRIEVVRGPATLLYGANAIGGLVNVITEQIPTEPVRGTHGGLRLDFGTGAREGGASADVTWGNGRWALHAGGTGRGSGDVRTPAGRIDNSQARSGSADIGLSWTRENHYLGGSYGYDDQRYGVPVVEDGGIELTPERHDFAIRGGGRDLDGLLKSYRATLAVRRYQHQELEGDEIGTIFRNDTLDVDLLAEHRPLGRVSGAVGISAGARGFEAVGEEALAPPVDQRQFAAYLYEELTWPHVTVQMGARVDHVRYEPEGGLRARRFTNVSGSAGLLVRPPAVHDSLTIAVSLARAARNPALEELYFFGPHAGNFAFEIGNPDLESEVGFGLDLSLRWQTRRVSGEVTWFRNAIDDFIFRNPLTPAQIVATYGPEFDAEDFQVVQFAAADSVLTGIEAHADVHVTEQVTLEGGIDYVRGTNEALDVPLPRIPPLRVRGGLRYQRNALQAGGEVVATADQDRVFGAESTTPGAAILKLFGAYSWQTGPAVSTITARLDNATNRRYWNHLSYIRDFVPEMGRSFKVIYGLEF
jgi:iron complex outermembrane receptor protein